MSRWLTAFQWSGVVLNVLTCVTWLTSREPLVAFPWFNAVVALWLARMIDVDRINRRDLARGDQ